MGSLLRCFEIPEAFRWGRLRYDTKNSSRTVFRNEKNDVGIVVGGVASRGRLRKRKIKHAKPVAEAVAA